MGILKKLGGRKKITISSTEPEFIIPKEGKLVEEKELPVEMLDYIKRVNKSLKKFDRTAPKLQKPWAIEEKGVKNFHIGTLITYKGIPLSVGLGCLCSKDFGKKLSLALSSSIYAPPENTKLLPIYQQLLKWHMWKTPGRFGIFDDGTIACVRHLEVEKPSYPEFEHVIAEFTDFVGWGVIELAKQFPFLTQ